VVDGAILDDLKKIVVDAMVLYGGFDSRNNGIKAYYIWS
jgi:hypothetical protein